MDRDHMIESPTIEKVIFKSLVQASYLPCCYDALGYGIPEAPDNYECGSDNTGTNTAKNR